MVPAGSGEIVNIAQTADYRPLILLISKGFLLIRTTGWFGSRLFEPVNCAEFVAS
jgi:hypothetical protein